MEKVNRYLTPNPAPLQVSLTTAAAGEEGAGAAKGTCTPQGQCQGAPSAVFGRHVVNTKFLVWQINWEEE